jgi:hypothetical protein
MKLFEVVYWGRLNDADDIDTIYLVRAPDSETAKNVVIEGCDRSVHPRQKPHYVPDRIFELGMDTGKDTETRILRGPYFHTALNYGWPMWCREDEYDPASPWIQDTRF